MKLKKNISLYKSGVGKLRPAGQLRPAKGKSAARDHLIFLNGMRPAKENFVAREHVNVARKEKKYKDSFVLSPCMKFKNLFNDFTVFA